MLIIFILNGFNIFAGFTYYWWQGDEKGGFFVFCVLQAIFLMFQYLKSHEK